MLCHHPSLISRVQTPRRMFLIVSHTSPTSRTQTEACVPAHPCVSRCKTLPPETRSTWFQARNQKSSCTRGSFGSAWPGRRCGSSVPHAARPCNDDDVVAWLFTHRITRSVLHLPLGKLSWASRLFLHRTVADKPRMLHHCR